MADPAEFDGGRQSDKHRFCSHAPTGCPRFDRLNHQDGVCRAIAKIFKTQIGTRETGAVRFPLGRVISAGIPIPPGVASIRLSI